MRREVKDNTATESPIKPVVKQNKDIQKEKSGDTKFDNAIDKLLKKPKK